MPVLRHSKSNSRVSEQTLLASSGIFLQTDFLDTRSLTALYESWLHETMRYHLLTDLILLIHIAFVGFVLLGGLLALIWRPVTWLHLPAAAWGAIVELSGWICPLTPLENWLREQAGESGYRGDFIAYYLLPILYPDALTREVQVTLGLVVVLLNAAVYWWLWRKQIFVS
jgi:hypothetical protein